MGPLDQTQQIDRLRGLVGQVREVVGRQRPSVDQLVEVDLDTPCLGQLRVVLDDPVALQQLVQRRAVAVGVLAQVQPHQVEPEDAHLAAQATQPAVANASAPAARNDAAMTSRSPRNAAALP